MVEYDDRDRRVSGPHELARVIVYRGGASQWPEGRMPSSRSMVSFSAEFAGRCSRLTVCHGLICLLIPRLLAISTANSYQVQTLSSVA